MKMKKRKRSPEFEIVVAKKGKTEDSIPDEIFLTNILPRLSFRSLCIAKMVCRSWRATISDDPSFALLQSLLPSPTSVGSVSSGFLFLPTHCSPVGADPLNLNLYRQATLRITASSNGLLCLCRRQNRMINISLINPATGEWAYLGHRVAQSVGLVFDPVASPDRFTLVTFNREKTCVGYRFRFEVFRSESGEWTPCEEETRAAYLLWFEAARDPVKSVQARGIIYWDCVDYILWFDTGRDDAFGFMRPPFRRSSWAHELGVWEGRMTLTRCSGDGIQIWATSDTYRNSFDIVHMISWEAVKEGENGKLFDELLGAKETDKSHLVGMLPFEGGERVYLKLKNTQEPNVVKVISYNFRTKVAEWFQFDGMKELSDVKDPIFGYHNSMVIVPKVFRKEAKHE